MAAQEITNSLSRAARPHRNAEGLLSRWAVEAKRRAVVIMWFAHRGAEPGLVRSCQPGTARAFVEAANRHGFAGVLFAGYGQRSGPRYDGIQTNPALVKEIKECSKELGLTRHP